MWRNRVWAKRIFMSTALNDGKIDEDQFGQEWLLYAGFGPRTNRRARADIRFWIIFWGPSFRDGPKDQTSDAQVRTGESRDSRVRNGALEVRAMGAPE